MHNPDLFLTYAPSAPMPTIGDPNSSFKALDGLFSCSMNLMEKIVQLAKIALDLIRRSFSKLSDYSLNYRPTFFDKIDLSTLIKKISDLFCFTKKIEIAPDIDLNSEAYRTISMNDDMSVEEMQKTARHNLQVETRRASIQIGNIKEAFQKMVVVINRDPELKLTFDLALRISSSLLPKLEVGKAVKSPIVAAWKKANHELEYWIKLKKLFFVFLTANPQFREKLSKNLPLKDFVD